MDIMEYAFVTINIIFIQRMGCNIVFVLINRLFKVYISNSSNKGVEYRKVLFYTLEEYGGIYVKFLQVLPLEEIYEEWSTSRGYDVFHHVKEEYMAITSDFVYGISFWKYYFSTK